MGKPGYSEAYQRYMICKEFGWDFYTYNLQPQFFIEELTLIINQVNRTANDNAKRAERRSALRRK